MADGFVLLTPLVVLVVILLLGFAGCQLIYPAESHHILTIKARVPSELTILESRFEWTAPGASTPESETDPDRRDDGPDITELSHLIGEVPTGSWMVFCRLRVRQPTPGGGGREAVDDATGMFTLGSDDENTVAIFATSGSPAGLDFKVLFTGAPTD